MSEIPEAAIEAAARAMCTNEDGAACSVHLPDARRALAAAEPAFRAHIAETLREIADNWNPRDVHGGPFTWWDTQTINWLRNKADEIARRVGGADTGGDLESRRDRSGWRERWG